MRASPARLPDLFGVPLRALRFAGLTFSFMAIPSFTQGATPIRVESALRLRYDGQSRESALGDTLRHRFRARLRIGATRQMAPDLSAGARLTTGSADPTSGNITLGDGFVKKDLRLDRLWVRWEPRPGTALLAGKLQNPIAHEGLVWDEDVSPEGIAALLEGSGASLILGYFVLEERESDADATVGVAQIGLARPSPNGLGWRIAGTYHELGAVEGTSLRFSRGSNALDVEGALANDYDLISGLVVSDWKGARPWRCSAEAVRNVAVGHENIGYSIELRAGSAARARDWQVMATGQRLEREAVLDALAESGWHSMRTNYEGLRLGVRTALREGWRLSISARLMRSLTGARTHERRLTLDSEWDL